MAICEMEVFATFDKHGKKIYTITLDPVGRWSDVEEHDFRPDVAESFEVGTRISVKCILFYHYDAETLGIEENRDIRLVVVFACQFIVLAFTITM